MHHHVGIVLLLFVVALSAGQTKITSRRCNPKTIDFRKAVLLTEAYAKFEPDWFPGKWYMARWYLPQKSTVSDERYDLVSIVTEREGFDDRYFTDHYSRNKTTGCCNEVLRGGALVRQAPGVYDWNDGESTDVVRVFYAYANEVFLLEVHCIGINEERNACEDYYVNMWAKFPEPRPQDIARGVAVLEEICYPDMKRFLCGKHMKDCSEMHRKGHKRPCDKKMNRCGDEDGMQKKKGRFHDNDDDNDHYHRRMRRWDRDDDDDWRWERKGRMGHGKDDDDDEDDDDHDDMKGRRNDKCGDDHDDD